MNRLKQLYRRLMKTHNRNLFLIELTFKVAFLVFVIPLLYYGLELAMHLWGQSYITSENIMSFLFNPPTLVLFILVLILLPLYLLFKMITMVYYCSLEDCIQKKQSQADLVMASSMKRMNSGIESHVMNKKLNIPLILYISFRKTRRCIQSGNLPLLFFSLFLYVLTNLPLLVGFTLFANFELKGGASDVIFMKSLLILCCLFISFIAFRGMFVLHFCVNERLSFQNAIEQSKQLLHRRSKRTIMTLLLVNVILAFLFLMVYYLILLVTAVLVYLLTDKSTVISVFLSLYPRINLYVSIFFNMIAFIANINLITTFFTAYLDEDFKDIFPEEEQKIELAPLSKAKKRRYILNSFIIFVMIAGVINFYITIQNKSLYLSAALSGIQISSHRGNSHVAPENTLPALENAIAARSDYAEIDVRQTKDGVLILLHDKNLLRTAGINKNLQALTYQELSNLDVGSWFGKDYFHTRMPTLEEALNLCKGRIKLNIEIKNGKKDYQLEERLVELIKQYNFEHQCLISSADYDVLVKIKQLDSEIKTGYILSAAYGNFYNKEAIDFFSIRSSFVTRNVVESAHRAGKEVQAWTVNSASEIERMKSVGVDCIITDNPTLTRKVLYEDNTNKTFIELLNRMIQNRTFYRILLH